MGGEYTVIKGTGEVEEFSEYKFNHSLKQAGVDKDTRQEIIEIVTKDIDKHIDTDEIHQKALSFLLEHDPASAARYNLRQAIMQLGPTGFPFEGYVAAILAKQGYQTETNQIVHGKCATHEVDVIAYQKSQRYMIECKYHNARGTRSDIKTALYIWARFEDIHEAWSKSKKISERFHHAWLVTNTKVTSDAEQYAKCRGLHVVSWYRPYRNSLKDMIVNNGMWPITCLNSLSNDLKQELISRQIVLCSDLIKTTKEEVSDLDWSILKQAIKESEFVCKVKNVEVGDRKD